MTHLKLTSTTTDEAINQHVTELWYKFMLQGGQSFFVGDLGAKLRQRRDQMKEQAK